MQEANREPTLTDQAFWDHYWENVSGWQNIDTRHSYDRCFDRVFRRWLTPGPEFKMMEIGCAPGRWLIYFYQQFGYQVAGCDSAPQAVNVTRANLARADVPGEVIFADFMADTIPAQAYDVVLSLGFIEHFTDPWPVIARHACLIKPGGMLVLEVPNYTGLNGWILKQSWHRYLDIHNTSVMHLAFFQEIATRFNLEPRFIGFVGGPEPGLWDSTGQCFLLRNLIRVASRLRKWMPFLDHVNHSFLSGYLIGIYQREVHS